MGMSVQDLEDRECDKVCELLDAWVFEHAEVGDPEVVGYQFAGLIKVLVSNGTLTAKQVARALGKAEATSRVDSPVAEQAIACPVVQLLQEPEQK